MNYLKKVGKDAVVKGAELAIVGDEVPDEGGVGVGLEIEEAVKEVNAEEDADSNAKEGKEMVAEDSTGGKRKKPKKKKIKNYCTRERWLYVPVLPVAKKASLKISASKQFGRLKRSR
jgi:hypothetical protein